MRSAYQKTYPAAPAQPVAGEAFTPGLTPGVLSLEPDSLYPLTSLTRLIRRSARAYNRASVADSWD